MPATIDTPRFVNLLERLWAAADASKDEVQRWMSTQSPEELATRREDAADYRIFYRENKGAYLALPRSLARLLYILARTHRARTIVEFGTSFGISTLYLAAGVHDNGGGAVIGSEFDADKAGQARRNLEEAGLGEGVEIREGDALDTLAGGIPGPVDLVFLDGAKQLYVPVLRLLEGRLAPGSLVVADNVDESPDYLRYVRGSGDYVSTGSDERFEVSLRA